MTKLIKIAQIGQGVTEFALEGCVTVGSALRAANKSASGLAIRVNDEPARMSTELDDGDLVTLVPDVKGGC